MAGLRAFSSCIPFSRKGTGESARSVSAPDEDALTLAVDAALPIVDAHRLSGGAMSGASFASIVPPAPGKSCASIAGAACDLPLERARSIDFAGTPRAGVQALIAAWERLAADPFCADVLITASDVREGAAAVALIAGRKDPIAEILGVHSVSASTLEDPGSFTASMRAAIAGALTSARVQPSDVARFAIGAPSAADATALLEATRVDTAKLAPLFLDRFGDTGCAQPLLSLVASLESMRPGEVVVLAAWGDGADAVVVRATDALARQASPRTVAAQLEGSLVAAPVPAAGVATAAGPGLRFAGSKCRRCAAVQFPPSAVCAVCRQEGSDPIRLSRLGRTAAAEHDGLVLVDLAGGGRLDVAITGSESRLDAGTPVTLALRRGAAGYVWKARPNR